MSGMSGQDDVDNPAMTPEESHSVNNSDSSKNHQHSTNHAANNAATSKPPSGTMVVVDRDLGPRRFQKLRNVCERYV